MMSIQKEQAGSGSITMKKFALIFAVVSFLSGCGERAAPGTAPAARFMAAEFVGKMFNIESVVVNQDPVVEGNAARVVTTDKQRTCNLVLVKTDNEKKYGWLVDSIKCHSSK